MSTSPSPAAPDAAPAPAPPSRTPSPGLAAARIGASTLLAAAGIAALAKPPLPETARVVAIAVIAVVAALSSRSGMLLWAARRGLLTIVETGAARHRLFGASGPAALVALALASPLLLVPAPHSRFAVFCAGAVGAVVGLALSARDKRPKAPRSTTRLRWLLLDTAAPSGLVAGGVGVCFAFLRLHSLDVVPPGELARHLGVTTFAWALFLGLAGFFKTYSEQSAGLVVLRDARPPAADSAVPNPLLVGGVVGVAFLLGVAHLVPPLALHTVLVVKFIVGVIVGGGLSLLGAILGARAAALGLTARRPRRG